MKKAKVSVICIAYNQQNYIRQTLDSFIMQKTSFPVEFIVADDASTDDTPKIITEYANKYPNIIRPILRSKNLGPQRNLIDALNKSDGEYVALCEGDDFWTDSDKIQKQSDFLDNKPQYSIVFHPVRVFYEKAEHEEAIYPEVTEQNRFNIKNLLSHNFIQTNSVMYRRIDDYNIMNPQCMPFDWYLHLTHVQNKKIGFIDEVMSSYRRHAGGVWWQDTKKSQDALWLKYGAGHVALYSEMTLKFGNTPEYKRIISKHLTKTAKIIGDIDNRSDAALLQEVVKKFPKLFADELLRGINENEKEANVIESMDLQMNELKRELSEKNAELMHCTEELENIKNSKLWRLRSILK